jgi:hypothetical protein
MSLGEFRTLTRGFRFEALQWAFQVPRLTRKLLSDGSPLLRSGRPSVSAAHLPLTMLDDNVVTR